MLAPDQVTARSSSDPDAGAPCCLTCDDDGDADDDVRVRSQFT